MKNKFWFSLFVIFVLVGVWSLSVQAQKSSKVLSATPVTSVTPVAIGSGDTKKSSGRSFKSIARLVQQDFNKKAGAEKLALMQELGNQTCLKQAADCAFKNDSSRTCNQTYKQCREKK